MALVIAVLFYLVAVSTSCTLDPAYHEFDAHQQLADIFASKSLITMLQRSLTTSRFLRIFLLLLVSETQSNLWNQINLTRPVIIALGNFSFIFSRN